MTLQVKDLSDKEALDAVVTYLVRSRAGEHFPGGVLNILSTYPRKVVERKLERLEQRRLLDCGVTILRPWLTPEGEAYLRDHS